MSQSSVDLLTELHREWMENSTESREILQNIENRIDDAWKVFQGKLYEQFQCGETGSKGSMTGLQGEMGMTGKFDEYDIPTPKDMSRSARIHARRPLIGNKSSGGCARIVKWENDGKNFTVSISQRGEDAHTFPNRQSQRQGGDIRGISSQKGFRFSFPNTGETKDANVYTTFAFKKYHKRTKKNKSRRDMEI